MFFEELQSHYLFREAFLPGGAAANEKGVVEGVIKYTRLNFFVPVPQVPGSRRAHRWRRQMCRRT